VVRVAFFFHYLAPEGTLRTPAGEVSLPPVSARPRRLQFMRYEEP
jgi:hypothetical protein